MIIGDNNKLHISGEEIPYSVKQGRPNRVRLSFREGNELCIETSTGNLGDFERSFLEQKSRWILKSYRRTSLRERKRRDFLARIDHQVPLLGDVHQLEFLVSPNIFIDFNPPGPFRVHAPARLIKAHRRRVLYHALFHYAETYLRARTEELAAHCGLEFNRVKIKDLRSKWGSCSELQNINLNWHLIFLPATLVDYVIIHELMHLRVMDHSANFWSWVARYYPGYKEARKKVNAHAWMLGILS